MSTLEQPVDKNKIAQELILKGELIRSNGYQIKNIEAQEQAVPTNAKRILC